MNLAIFAKGFMIAVCAAVVAWLPFAIFLTLDTDPNLKIVYAFRLLWLALLGSFAVGLPVALLAFFLTRRKLPGNPGTVFLMANLSGVMLMLASFALGHVFGLFFLGVPSFIAANIFALLGWFWVVRPMTSNRNG